MVLILFHMLRTCLPTGLAPVEAGLGTRPRTRNSIPPLAPAAGSGGGERGAARGPLSLVVKPVSTGAKPVGTKTVRFKTERRTAGSPFGARARRGTLNSTGSHRKLAQEDAGIMGMAGCSTDLGERRVLARRFPALANGGC